MKKASCEIKEKYQKYERRNYFWDIIIGLILALITMVTVPETILETVAYVSKLTTGTDNYWRGWNWLSYILALIILGVIIVGYREKIKIFFVNKRMQFDLRREEKINSINRVVFDALYSSNSADRRNIPIHLWYRCGLESD